MTRMHLVWPVMGSLLCACSLLVDDPVAEPPERVDRASSAVSQQVPAPTYMGFLLTPAKSRFGLGEVVHQEPLGSFVRTVGTHGAFAVGPNGIVAAALNADAPEATRPAFSSDPVVHNARVYQYFVDAGIPQDQIGDITFTTMMRGGGALGERKKDDFLGFTTVINRSIDGISVQGSYAWARFNADDIVTAEEVYWPAISLGVGSEAKLLAAKLQLPGGQQSLRDRLPQNLRDREVRVAVHHSRWDAPEFRVAAGYVLTGMGTDADRFFDDSGLEISW